MVYVLVTETMSPEQRQEFDETLAGLDPLDARRRRLAFARLDGGVSDG